MTQRIIIFCAFLFTMSGIRATSLRFYNLEGKTQGLSIRDICQDSIGMIWLTTDQGRFTYDGYDLRRHDHSKIRDAHRSYNAEEKIYVDTILRGHHYIATDHLLIEECQGRHTTLLTHLIYPSSIIEGEDSTLLYIGMANGLGKYDISRNRMLAHMSLPVVKTMLRDGDRLFVGTDDGLFVGSLSSIFNSPLESSYFNSTAFTRYSHDAFTTDVSLASNVVWSLFRDLDGNIWVGTDDGLSILPNNPCIEWHYLTDITHQRDGCRITHYLTDSHGRTWLGGTDGIICQDSYDFRWYRMGADCYPLPHNRVRCFFEDSQHRIFAGTDGGLLQYNEQTQQFERHPISSDRSNWVYDIWQPDASHLKVRTHEANYLLDYTTLEVVKTSPRKKRQLEVYTDASGREWRRDRLSGLLWTGGTDRYGLSTSEALMQTSTQARRIAISHVAVIGRRNIGLDSVRSGRIMLPYLENNIVVAVSDFSYQPEHLTTYQYRFAHQGDDWLSIDDNKIRLTYLTPGTYHLEICANNNPSSAISFQLNILPPWYLSWPMKAFYVLLLLLLVAGVVVFMVQRKTLRLERQQRDIMLAHAKTKEEELQRQLIATAQANSEVTHSLSADDTFLHDITQLIEKNMESDQLNPAFLASETGVNQKQIYRKLKQLTGMTTVEYIRHIRLNHAAFLLGHGNFTVAEVMYRVGFTNPSYFARAFSAQHGMTPSECSRRH